MRTLFLFCYLVLVVQLQGQTSLQRNGFTYKFVMTDYNTLDIIFRNANDPDLVLEADEMNYAGEIGYFRSINKSLNLGMPLRLGSIDSHHKVYDPDDIDCQPCDRRKRNELFFGTDILAIYKLNNDYILKETFFLAPYILLGVGAVYMSQRDGNFDFQIPMGVGLNIKLNASFYLQAQFEYRKSLVINKDNFAISGGIVWISDFKKKVVESPK